jgi:arylsulfatase B
MDSMLLIRLAPLLTVLLACHGDAVTPANTSPIARDNVLLIIGDDLGNDRVAIYGEHPEPGNTPVLDALARGGVLFRNAYSQPVCSPSRMAMLSGRQGFRTGIGTGVPWLGVEGANGDFVPSDDELSLAEALNATHHTTAVGKWHLATERDGGFDHPITTGFEFFTGTKQNLTATPNAQAAYFDWEKNVADRDGNRQHQVLAYATSDNVDDALELISAHGDEPWFIWLAFNTPHTPFHAPPDELHTVDLSGEPSEVMLHKAMVEAMDTEIGRLLANMPAEVRARTHVIFVGDNGTPGGAIQPPWSTRRGKATVFEGGINVPLIVSGPAVAEPGREVNGLVHLVDIFSTVLELAGADDPGTGTDSVSFAPYLRDPSQAPLREWVYSERFRPNGFGPYTDERWAIRDARYKLSRDGHKSSFYDLAADPFEHDDLLGSLSEEQGAALARLREAVQELRASAD